MTKGKLNMWSPLSTLFLWTCFFHRPMILSNTNTIAANYKDGGPPFWCFCYLFPHSPTKTKSTNSFTSQHSPPLHVNLTGNGQFKIIVFCFLGYPLEASLRRHQVFSCRPGNVSAWILANLTIWSLEMFWDFQRWPSFLVESPPCPTLDLKRKQEISLLFGYLPLLYASYFCKSHLKVPERLHNFRYFQVFRLKLAIHVFLRIKIRVQILL